MGIAQQDRDARTLAYAPRRQTIAQRVEFRLAPDRNAADDRGLVRPSTGRCDAADPPASGGEARRPCGDSSPRRFGFGIMTNAGWLPMQGALRGGGPDPSGRFCPAARRADERRVPAAAPRQAVRPPGGVGIDHVGDAAHETVEDDESAEHNDNDFSDDDSDDVRRGGAARPAASVGRTSGATTWE